jgi:hypothetical protein
MKRYIAESTVPTGNGTHLKINDLATLQAYSEAIDKLLTDFNTPFVVSGCVLTALAFPNFAVSEGIVLLNGKLHTLPAIASLNLTSPKYICYLSNTPTDSRPLFGGGTANIFETYLAQAASTIPVTGDYITIGAGGAHLPARFSDVVAGIEAPITLSLTPVQFSEVSPVRYRKNKQGLVKLSGAAQKMQNNGANIVATLPIGYRPSQIKNFAITEDAYIFAAATVYTNGEIWVNPTAALNKIYWLDGISFYTDM